MWLNTLAELPEKKMNSFSKPSTSKYLTGPQFHTPTPSTTTPSYDTFPALVNPEPPHPYHPSLTPVLSPLHPHCQAKDHLCLWLPIAKSPQGVAVETAHGISMISEQWLNHILDVIAASWTEKTKEIYGAGLLVFHVYCDIHHITEALRCPITQPLLLAFLTSCAGAYLGSMLSNFVTGLYAWHELHGQLWMINHDEL